MLLLTLIVTGAILYLPDLGAAGRAPRPHGEHSRHHRPLPARPARARARSAPGANGSSPTCAASTAGGLPTSTCSGAGGAERGFPRDKFNGGQKLLGRLSRRGHGRRARDRRHHALCAVVVDHAGRRAPRSSTMPSSSESSLRCSLTSSSRCRGRTSSSRCSTVASRARGRESMRKPG